MHLGQAFNILTYNTHVAIDATNRAKRAMNLWQHILPSKEKASNLIKISKHLGPFDIIGIQESDAGSLRSGFTNHTEKLAQLARFGHWADQVNRDWGGIARHSMGVISNHRIHNVSHHKLPGSIAGRSLMLTYFDLEGQVLAFAMTHLSLGEKDRIRQSRYIGETLSKIKTRVILVGDFNCGFDSEEISLISDLAGLRVATGSGPTYPSWNPKHRLDHILVSDGIQIDHIETLDKLRLSDHLPLGARIIIR